MIDQATIEAIAQRTAEILLEHQQPTSTPTPWISVHEKAQQLGVPASLIYRHPAAVGGIKIGDRWRFPPEPPTPPTSTPEPRRPTRKRRCTPTTHVDLLPIHRP